MVSQVGPVGLCLAVRAFVTVRFLSQARSPACMNTSSDALIALCGAVVSFGLFTVRVSRLINAADGSGSPVGRRSWRAGPALLDRRCWTGPIGLMRCLVGMRCGKGGQGFKLACDLAQFGCRAKVDLPTLSVINLRQ